MDSVVVYESHCGNTSQVARAVADALSEHGTVKVISVGEAGSGPIAHADLLVVGAPTHVWGMSWHWTRRAADRYRHRAGEPTVGMRDWLRRSVPVMGRRRRRSTPDFDPLLGWAQRPVESPAACEGEATASSTDQPGSLSRQRLAPYMKGSLLGPGSGQPSLSSGSPWRRVRLVDDVRLSLSTICLTCDAREF